MAPRSDHGRSGGPTLQSSAQHGQATLDRPSEAISPMTSFGTGASVVRPQPRTGSRLPAHHREHARQPPWRPNAVPTHSIIPVDSHSGRRSRRAQARLSRAGPCTSPTTPTTFRCGGPMSGIRSEAFAAKARFYLLKDARSLPQAKLLGGHEEMATLLRCRASC